MFIAALGTNLSDCNFFYQTKLIFIQENAFDQKIICKKGGHIVSAPVLNFRAIYF